MKISKLYPIMFVMSIIGLFSSCNNDKDKLPSLEGTVWIHQYTPEEHVTYPAADAFCFGKDKVERFALDENLKVLRLISTLDYQVREGAIVIDMKVCPMGDNYLYFWELIYCRSNKSIADILSENN